MTIKKKIINIFVYFLILVNRLSLKIFNTSFIGYLKEQIENQCYISKIFENKKLIFFCPNKLIEWRVKTFLEKEPETLEWISNFDKNNPIIFWDIGANIGLYSLYTSIKFEKADIFAFEPSTSNLRVLSRNISINNFSNKIKIINQPLSDVKTSFSIFNESSFQEGGALNTFKEKYNFTGKEINFENKYFLLGTNINDLIDKQILQIPNYIKIDVDGIEHLILNGADKYLSHKKIKSILIEVNENFDEQFKNIKDIMIKCNFSLIKKDRNENFYENPEFEKMYNYIFQKNEN